MGSQRGAASRASMVVGSAVSRSAWCDAAESVRSLVRTLAMPAHVAGYLRGQADALEFYCAVDAPTNTDAGDIVAPTAGRLAAYARQPPAASQPGIADQHRRIEIAAKQGWFTVVAWHEDKAAPAQNQRTPSLQKARAAIRAGRAGGIVVADIARLGRNSLDVLDLVERSHTEGWRLIALDCNLDSATPAGQIVLQTLRLARRTEWRKVPKSERRPARRPKRASNRADPADVDPATVQRMQTLRADGLSYRTIAAALNQNPATHADQPEWGASSVRRILHTTRSTNPRKDAR